MSYKGRLRRAEPHDYGIKRGSTMLLIYQVHDQGREGVKGWRLLDVAKIEACTVSKSTFPGSRGESSQRHIVWDELFARVA
jgi:hypothetical protein